MSVHEQSMAKSVTIKKKPAAAGGKAKEMKSQHKCTGGTVCKIAMQVAKTVYQYFPYKTPFLNNLYYLTVKICF